MTRHRRTPFSARCGCDSGTFSRPDFQPCLEHDFIGANARARRVDERCAKKFPVRAVKRPAIRIDGCPDVFLWRLAARGWRRVRDAASRHFRAGIAGHLRQPLPRQHARSRVPKGVVRSVQEEDLHSTQSTLVGEVEFVDGLASHSEQWAVVSSISPLKSGRCESYSSTKCATNGIWQKI